MIRIAIDARLREGAYGGVQQSLMSLAAALSEARGTNEEYAFLTVEGSDAWLQPLIRGWARTITIPGGLSPRRLARSLRYRVDRALGSVEIDRSDGQVERGGFDVVHFPTQDAFITDVPSIYQPWDLQHLNFPEFFTDEEKRIRAVRYPLFCKRASLIAVGTEAVRNDVATQYGVPPDKIVVVPTAPVTRDYPRPDSAELARVRSKYDLPERFLYYPARTYPHKNHIRLLEALALIRDRDGIDIPLIASGSPTEFFTEVTAAMTRLRLSSQVRFIGYVPEGDVVALYTLCTSVVFPTLFEGWGQPIVEAFDIGAPVTCSNIAPLREVADEGALLFEPTSIHSIANAVLSIWKDEGLRDTLRARGRERTTHFTAERMAKGFSAMYQRVARRQ